jgi:osmoprotectant transport system ATP-binding protein
MPWILMNAIVEFQNITHAYGEQPLFVGLNLELPASETTAIVGSSGSGKSTLLGLINGLLRPDSGQVRVFDAPLPYQALSAFRRRIGYAVQGTGLFPHLDIAGNISVMARLSGWSEAAATDRVRELMSLMALDETLASRFPHELSGGQQQRAGICRALMLKPELLLLDEPFSGVDPLTRADIHKRFAELSGRAVSSTILVTHDMAEALTLASHLVILQQGSVAQSGSLDAILAAPANDHVRALLASANV